MTADECIAIMVERVVAKFHSLKILLFGSHARGDAEPHSDIDLIIVFPFVEDTYKLMGEIRGAVSGLGFAKDVIVATPDDIERGANLPGHLFSYAIPESGVLYDRTT